MDTFLYRKQLKKILSKHFLIIGMGVVGLLSFAIKLYFYFRGYAFFHHGWDIVDLMAEVQSALFNNQFSTRIADRPFVYAFLIALKQMTGILSADLAFLAIVLSLSIGVGMMYVFGKLFSGNREGALFIVFFSLTLLVIFGFSSSNFYSWFFSLLVLYANFKYLRGNWSVFGLGLIFLAALGNYSHIFLYIQFFIAIYFLIQIFRLSFAGKKDVYRFGNFFLALAGAFGVFYLFYINSVPPEMATFPRFLWEIFDLRRFDPEMVGIFLELAPTLFFLVFIAGVMPFIIKALQKIFPYLPLKNRELFKIKNFQFQPLYLLLIIGLSFFLLLSFSDRFEIQNQFSFWETMLSARRIALFVPLLVVFSLLMVFPSLKKYHFAIFFILPLFPVLLYLLPATNVLPLLESFAFNDRILRICAIPIFMLLASVLYQGYLKKVWGLTFIFLITLILAAYSLITQFKALDLDQERYKGDFFQALRWYETHTSEQNHGSFAYIGLTANRRSAAKVPPDFDGFLKFESDSSVNWYDYYEKFFIHSFFESKVPLKFFDQYNLQPDLESICNPAIILRWEEIIKKFQIAWIFAEKSRIAADCPLKLGKLGTTIFSNNDVIIYATAYIKN